MKEWQIAYNAPITKALAMLHQEVMGYPVKQYGFIEYACRWDGMLYKASWRSYEKTPENSRV